MEAVVVAVAVFEILADARSSVGSTQKWSTAISTAEYLADHLHVVSEDKTNGADLDGV